MVRRPKEGLELLDLLKGDRQISQNYRMDFVLAHLLEMAGDSRAAERATLSRGCKQKGESP